MEVIVAARGFALCHLFQRFKFKEQTAFYAAEVSVGGAT